MNFNLTVLTGFKKYTIISKSKIFEAAIRLIFALILLNFGWGLNGVLLSYGLGYFIVFIWTQKFISPNILSTNEASYTLDRKSIYSMALKFFFAGLFFQIALNMSSIYVQHYYSSTINGYWTAGMNISRITLLFTDAVNQVLFPELIGERNNNIRTGFIKRSLMIILLITGLSSIVCWIMPDFIINLIYGPAYIHASLFLKWQSLFMILISLIQLYYTVYFSKINYSENNKKNKEISI
jgi:O-antigen/teichoic acid export membrane protein